MLFITNRMGSETPEPEVGSRIAFHGNNNQAGQNVHFCRRNAPADYTEIGSEKLLAELKQSPAQQVLIYVHGCNSPLEEVVFPRTQAIQEMCDAMQPGMVRVVPIVWPSGDGTGNVRQWFDDRDAADASTIAYYRLLEMFLAWQRRCLIGDSPCTKRINVLAHSTGNRILRNSLERWGKYVGNGSIPLIFRNVFLVAADIAEESLAHGAPGDYICQASRNVVVYYAADDAVLKSGNSVISLGKVVSNRLGRTGPQDPALLPLNVFVVDCNEVSHRYDVRHGHAYFLDDDRGQPGQVFRHMLNAMLTGRVEVDDQVSRMKFLRPA